MIAVKTLEVRDHGTCLVVFAMRIVPPHKEHERRLLAHSGYGLTSEDQEDYLFLSSNLKGGHNMSLNQDVYDWADRTYTATHRYLKESWNRLSDGDIVDVAFILGETKLPVSRTDMP